MLSESCVAHTPTPLFQHPSSQPPGQPHVGCAADGQWEQLRLCRFPPPHPPTEMNTIWIWIPTGSKKRNRHASSVQQLSLEAWGDERVSVSADIWGSYSEFTRSFKKQCHKYLCNWLEDCILALSFLKLAHRISDVHDSGLFFNAPLTFCSRLRNTYPVLPEIFFNQTA